MSVLVEVYGVGGEKRTLVASGTIGAIGPQLQLYARVNERSGGTLVSHGRDWVAYVHPVIELPEWVKPTGNAQDVSQVEIWFMDPDKVRPADAPPLGV